MVGSREGEENISRACRGVVFILGNFLVFKFFLGAGHNDLYLIEGEAIE